MDTVKRTFELAEQRNMSIYQLAQLCGISVSTIQGAKRRGYQLQVSTIERICEGLDIRLADFFAEQ